MEYVYERTKAFGKTIYEPSGSKSGSHVVLETNEYNMLIHNRDVHLRWYESEKQKREEDAKEAEQHEKEAVDAAYEDARQQLKKYKKEADDKAAVLVKKAEEEKKTAMDEAEKLKNLNKNLMRIARERANQARQITPKKNNDGYLVLESCQWQERYKHDFTKEEYAQLSDDIKRRYPDGYYEKRTASVWRSVVQTPYDASLPLNQIRSQIEDDDLWRSGHGILREIGCSMMSKNENNGIYSRGFDGEGKEVNRLYKWEFKANYRSGLWEVIIYTTKSLRVPPERRPYLNREKNKH